MGDVVTFPSRQQRIPVAARLSADLTVYDGERYVSVCLQDVNGEPIAEFAIAEDNLPAAINMVLEPLKFRADWPACNGSRP